MLPPRAVVFNGDLRLERKHWYSGKNSSETVCSFFNQVSAMQTKSFGFAIKKFENS